MHQVGDQEEINQMVPYFDAKLNFFFPPPIAVIDLLETWRTLNVETRCNALGFGTANFGSS